VATYVTRSRSRAVTLAVVLGLLTVGLAGATAVSAEYAEPAPSSDAGAAPGQESVTVTVTMDGTPADAQVVVRTPSGDVETVAYTDPLEPGRADLSLSPGRYTFEIDAGGGVVSERVYRNVTVDGYEVVSVDVDRRYEPNARGYYSADLHAHSIYSVDTNDSPMDEFVAAQLAADLDVLFISDHNTVRGHDELKNYAQKRDVPYLLSDELSTEADADRAADPTPAYDGGTYGHFNVYPIEAGQPVDWTGTPDDFFGAARDAGAEVIQANHPRRDDNYFHHIDSPEYNDSYETVEVYNRGYDGDEAETIDRLFGFWNQGYRYTAVGVSDDHESGTLGNEYGSPRTYVYMDQRPSGLGADFASAVDDQHAFVTYGPLVYLETAGGAIPGENATATNGTVTLTAEIRNVGELSSATIVRNGEPVRNVTLDGERATVEHEASVDDDSWFVVRVRDEEGAQGTRAMTNPIWVSADDDDSS
jgi:hypothetical protein